jgi:L-rhamnose mutarotase
MKMNIFTVILWPEIQDLMDEEGFEENSLLINEGKLYEEYGDSAYMVRVSWRKSVRSKYWKTYEPTYEPTCGPTSTI